MCSAKANKKQRILYVCYGAGHVNMLIPLILKTLSYANYEVLVLGLTTAGVVLERNGIPHIGFKDLVEVGDEEALEYGKKLASVLPTGGTVPYEETVAYMGLSFNDLVSRHGVEQAELLYKNKGRQAFLPTSILERLFINYQPHLLVSTNSPRAERAAFLVARKYKVPSVCVVGLFARQEVEWIGEAAFASRVCVISQGVKEYILAAGRFEDEVVVTGNPAMDRLARQSLKIEAENFKLLKGWSNKKIILWASQSEPKNHPFTGVSADPLLPRKVEQTLLLAASQHPDWQIVIRYHPSESVEPENWPQQAYISTTKDDLAILLKSVDVVLTMTSTVGLEGVLLGKPLITINQSVFRDDAPYAEMGLSKGVNDLSELEQTLVDVLAGNWQIQEKLPEVGTATDRVFRVMEELLN